MSESTRSVDKQRAEVRAIFRTLLSREPKRERCIAFFASYPNAITQKTVLGVLPQTVVAARGKAAEADLILFSYEGESSAYYGAHELVSPRHKGIKGDTASKLVLVDGITEAANAWADRIGEVEPHVVNREILCIGNRSHLFLLMGLNADLRQAIAKELSLPGGLPEGLHVLVHSALRNLLAAKVPPLIVLLSPTDEPEDEPKDPRRPIAKLSERDKRKGEGCG